MGPGGHVVGNVCYLTQPAGCFHTFHKQFFSKISLILYIFLNSIIVDIQYISFGVQHSDLTFMCFMK